MIIFDKLVEMKKRKMTGAESSAICKENINIDLA